MSGKAEGEPPRKKRRSKWDIHPEDLAASSSNTVATGNHETTHPSSAAAAMAAKLNAKLASEGKLKPSSAVYMPASSSVSLSPSPLACSSHFPPVAVGNAQFATPLISCPTSSTIEINDLDVREQLMKPATLTDINKTTGVMVTVRGKHPSPEERSQENSLLSISIFKDPVKRRSMPHYIQDKVFVGLEKAPEEFKAKARVEGIGGSFLGHIASQTGAKVYLRGRGSGFLEPTSGRESFEAMYLYISHGNQEGVTAARKLCQSLIQTVQEDFEMWKRSQQPLGFGGQTPQYHRPQFTNPYQHGAYQQPQFGPMPPGGGPNFGPPPPGAYPLPPPPGYGFYPGPPVPPPYGPPPPGGFGPPPPANFPQPGPPYQAPPPHQIPLPPDVPPAHLSSSHNKFNEKEEADGAEGVNPPPTKRRFTETVRSENGVSGQASAPYWAKLQETPLQRRFTEGPLPSQQSAVDGKREPLPPTIDPPQDQTGDHLTGQRPTEPSVQREEITPVKADPQEGPDGMPPPPSPGEMAVPTMPPPSFLPPRITSSTGVLAKPSEPPEASGDGQAPSSPPPSSLPADPPPPPPLSTPPATPKAPPSSVASVPLVSYGEDSDSDLDS